MIRLIRPAPLQALSALKSFAWDGQVLGWQKELSRIEVRVGNQMIRQPKPGKIPNLATEAHDGVIQISGLHAEQPDLGIDGFVERRMQFDVPETEGIAPVIGRHQRYAQRNGQFSHAFRFPFAINLQHPSTPVKTATWRRTAILFNHSIKPHRNRYRLSILML